MTIDNGLQNIGDSEDVIVVLFVKIRSPLPQLVIAGVVHVEHELQRSQDLGIKTLDAILEIVPGRFDGAGPLERILNMLAKDVRATTKDLSLPMR
jgi:hypothetical protein